jgi:uncharacterized protein (TIGR03792 family)
MVVEMLTFTVAAADQGEWLRVEEETWSRFLEQQPGFVAKQVWIDRENTDHVHCVITWADQASWDAVTADDCARVDAEMGEWFRPCTMRAFDVARTY